MSDNFSVIQVDHLHKDYGGTVAVDDLSFAVQRGEIFGIVGPNGAGKTTTMECLAGLRRADRGSLRVLGLDPRARSASCASASASSCSRPPCRMISRCGRRWTCSPPSTPTRSIGRPCWSTWGLAEKRNARFASLSGGQKQRLFIALALVNDPELVFLDEITTGLDPQARHNTWELVEKLREQGKTVLLVTHYMDEAERLCDRVAIIDHGSLVALDTPQPLIAGPERRDPRPLQRRRARATTGCAARRASPGGAPERQRGGLRQRSAAGHVAVRAGRARDAPRRPALGAGHPGRRLPVPHRAGNS